jgi:antitoxin ParD1/3/4
MPTRNVVLTDHQEKVIEAFVDSGRYQNASEVLRLVERREAHEIDKLEALREAARLGLGALDRGEFKEFNTVGDLERYLNSFSEEIISKSTK